NAILESSVLLAEGEQRELTLDAHSLAPVTVSGRVRVDSTPMAGGVIRAWFRPDPDQRGGATSFVAGCLLDPAGRFTPKDVPPGEYIFHVMDGFRIAHSRSIIAPRQRVPPGAASELKLELVTRAMRIHVVDAETKAPVKNRQVLIETRAGTMCEPVTDEN